MQVACFEKCDLFWSVMAASEFQTDCPTEMVVIGEDFFLMHHPSAVFENQSDRILIASYM